MPSQQNINELKSIQEKVNKAKSVVFADYKGLSVNNFNQLRSQVKQVGGEMLVTKNTLLRIAFENETLAKLLVGPTVAIFAYEDEIAPIKVVDEFSKENNLPVLTAGFFDNHALSQTDVVKLAQIPGKQELYAKIVGSLSSPISGLVNVLQGNTRSLIYALNAIKNSKSQ